MIFDRPPASAPASEWKAWLEELRDMPQCSATKSELKKAERGLASKQNATRASRHRKSREHDHPSYADGED